MGNVSHPPPLTTMERVGVLLGQLTLELAKAKQAMTPADQEPANKTAVIKLLEVTDLQTTAKWMTDNVDRIRRRRGAASWDP